MRSSIVGASLMMLSKCTEAGDSSGLHVRWIYHPIKGREMLKDKRTVKVELEKNVYQLVGSIGECEEAFGVHHGRE